MSFSVYFITVRQELGAIMKERAIVGVDEKADRQCVNKIEEITAGWNDDEFVYPLALKLADAIPASWNRKKK